MSFATRLYSLALRAYPRDFRDENREEVLGTLADLRDAGTGKGPLRQAISLGCSGNRMRWLHATGGSLAQTFRQGVAWGVLILIARQAGLGLYDVARSLLLPGWQRPSVASLVLTLGWLVVFGLLASRRRRWGLVLLGLVLAGYVANSVVAALDYGGPFSPLFTLSFFLPVLLPVLCAYAWPERSVRVRLPLALTILVLAALVPASSILFDARWLASAGSGLVSWGIQFGTCLIVGLFVLLASLSDPRWAVAMTVIAFDPILNEATYEIYRGRDLSGYLGVVLLAILIPTGALLLSFWARRRALPRRAC